MVGAERIIKMLNVVDDELVVEKKGFSIENFISARRIVLAGLFTQNFYLQ